MQQWTLSNEGHCKGKLIIPSVFKWEKHLRQHVVDHIKLVRHIKEQIESLNKHWSNYFHSFALSPCFGAEQCTPDSFRESIDPYELYIDSHLSLKTDRKEYYWWDLGSERPRDCSILELCRNICILQQPFHCCVALSHPDECFWFYSVMWLT